MWPSMPTRPRCGCGARWKRSWADAEPLLDQLVRPQEQRPRKFQAERLRGLEVDDQLEARGLIDRQICGLRALQNLVDVPCRRSNRVGVVGPVGHQAAAFGERAEEV